MRKTLIENNFNSKFHSQIIKFTYSLIILKTPHLGRSFDTGSALMAFCAGEEVSLNFSNSKKYRSGKFYR